VKNILGILVLLLFLGTVFAGLAQAQGYSEQKESEKMASGMPSEINPYIIVKRGALPNHIYDLEKWGGSAVQNDKYGIDLVVRAKSYAHYDGDDDELRINATVIAAGDVYKISETTIPTQGGTLVEKEYLKMKSLEIAASKDTVPNEIHDDLVTISIIVTDKKFLY